MTWQKKHKLFWCLTHPPILYFLGVMWLHCGLVHLRGKVGATHLTKTLHFLRESILSAPSCDPVSISALYVACRGSSQGRARTPCKPRTVSWVMGVGLGQKAWRPIQTGGEGCLFISLSISGLEASDKLGRSFTAQAKTTASHPCLVGWGGSQELEVFSVGLVYCFCKFIITKSGCPPPPLRRSF